jgi:ribosome biogenesis GTPase A
METEIQNLAICGATGAGKSSLLKALTDNSSIVVGDDPEGVTKDIY